MARRVGDLSEPFELCVFPRMTGFAFNRGVYLAYVLNRNGTVAIFESGPNGSMGWGYDDILDLAPTTFLNPKTIQPDPKVPENLGELDTAVRVVDLE